MASSETSVPDKTSNQRRTVYLGDILYGKSVNTASSWSESMPCKILATCQLTSLISNHSSTLLIFQHGRPQGRVCRAVVNECAEGRHDCSSHAACIDTAEGRCTSNFDTSLSPFNFSEYQISRWYIEKSKIRMMLIYISYMA